jgi:rhodanese-related sulfurtransferase
MRSLQAALFLERQGFDRMHNLLGGIDAWAVQVDPAMPRY